MTATHDEIEAFWNTDHEVLQLMRSRHVDGSTIHRRADSAKLGLAIEGGGMRGIISCAMLCALHDHGFINAFDAIYGGSIGSFNGAFFAIGDIWTALSVYHDYLASRKFIDFRRPMRAESIINLDFAFDVLERTEPLDYESVLHAVLPVHVAISLVDEIRTIAPARFDSTDDLKEALRAGVWFPVATRGTAIFRGQRAIDGGVLTAHPYRLAIADGCTHVLSLSTLPSTDRRAGPGVLDRIAAWHLNNLRPGLGDSYLLAERTGQLDRDVLRRWRTQPDANLAVLDLCLLTDVGIRRHGIDRGRLLSGARRAYETMAWALTSTYERAYPRFCTSRRAAID